VPGGAESSLATRPAPPSVICRPHQLVTGSIVDVRLPADQPSGMWRTAVYQGIPCGTHVVLLAGGPWVDHQRPTLPLWSLLVAVHVCSGCSCTALKSAKLRWCKRMGSTCSLTQCSAAKKLYHAFELTALRKAAYQGQQPLLQDRTHNTISQPCAQSASHTLQRAMFFHV
jgi:hypothetical protein